MSPDKIFTFIVLLILSIAAVRDIKTFTIPDILCGLIGITGILKVIVLPEMRKGAALGLLCAVTLMTVCKVVMKDGVGMGDAKLIVSLGFFLGLSRFVPFIVITSLLSALSALVLLLTKKMSRKDTLAFAPFILAGYILNMIYLHFGGRII